MMASGKAVELFMVDGTPGGMATAGIADWTGILTSARRDQLSQLYKREEANSNGVYILLGNDPEAIENTWCYIGKTENFVERLGDHDKKRNCSGKRSLLLLACNDLLTRDIGVI